MQRKLTFDQRQLKEIKFNLYYAQFLKHGTDGHNLRLLNAQFAQAFGFDLNEQGDLVCEGKIMTFMDEVQLNVTWNSEIVGHESS